MSHQAIVIGAGHNGLAAALVLAKAGRRVLVLERANRHGGLCAWQEFHPGYRVPGLLHETAHFNPELARVLGLDLRFETDERPTLAVSTDGHRLALYRDPARMMEALAESSPDDARAYPRWREFLDGVAPFVRSVLRQAPPPLSADTPADLWNLGKRGLALRKLGQTAMLELMRVVPMCAADWLNEHFHNPALKEALAVPAVAGGFVGPWSAGTAANLLIDQCMAGARIIGGPAVLVDALARSCREAGVEVRLSAPVHHIQVRDRRAYGVVLSSGEEIPAGVVVSSCDPKHTLLDLVDPAQLPLRLGDGIRAFRARGTTAKLHLAVKGPLDFNQWKGSDCETVRIGGGHLDDLERAFDAVKYGQASQRPNLEVYIPTVSDPTLAPAGGQVVSVMIHCAPCHPEGGWTQDARDRLRDKALAVLESSTGPLADRVAGWELLTPPDIEARFGVAGGHLHHGEHALDQLLCMRPHPLASRYATPIHGLFLAGGGSHPGGGVTGTPGALAANAILNGKTAP